MAQVQPVGSPVIETLETSQMLNQSLEPLRKFRWVIALDGIDAFTAMSATRPGGGSFGETMIPFINTKRYLAGTWTPDSWSLKLWDPIAPSQAQKVLAWVRLSYDVITGRAGYANIYKKNFHVKLLDPPGGVAQQWEIQGAWIQKVNFDDLSYESEGTVDIDLNIRYDRCVLRF